MPFRFQRITTQPTKLAEESELASGVQLEYLVLARKFRPQSFEDVAGQEHVVKTLSNAIGKGRVDTLFFLAVRAASAKPQ
jgi:replication-associated recombination protein RarA